MLRPTVFEFLSWFSVTRCIKILQDWVYLIDLLFYQYSCIVKRDNHSNIASSTYVHAEKDIHLGFAEKNLVTVGILIMRNI